MWILWRDTQRQRMARILFFSFIGNNHNLKPKAATDVLDALTVAMVEELGPRRAVPAHK